MQQHARIWSSAARSHKSGWKAGFAVGAGLVAVVAALVSAIVAYAWSIADEAPKINAALKDAERNTAPLSALRTTIEDASVITSGLQRGRTRLGG